MYKAKKALGQNFFTNKSLAIKIVGLVTADSPKKIVEIGPGTGSFTNLLYKENENLTLIEKDNELTLLLKSQFPKAIILNEDILDIETSKIVSEGDTPENTVLFGSLPYNISKKIIRRFIENPIANQMFFIIQKEVAQKYHPNGSKSNILSLTSQIYAESKILFNISPGSFMPRPKVESSLIYFRVKPISDNLEQIHKLEDLIKSAFARPRKTIGNNLKGKYIVNDPEIITKRPENLMLEDYIKLLPETF